MRTSCLAEKYQGHSACVSRGSDRAFHCNPEHSRANTGETPVPLDCQSSAGAIIGEFTDHTTRIPRRKYTFGNITSDHTARTDDRFGADADAGADDRAASNPDIGADADRFAEFLDASLGSVHGMARGIDLHFGAEETEVADLHFADIENHAVKIEIDALTQEDVGAVVAIEGWLEPDAVATLGEELFQRLAVERLFEVQGGVKLLAKDSSLTAEVYKLRVEGVIECAREHFFIFRLHR